MKVLIAYSSKTNNTKKVADAIFEKMPDAMFKRVEEITKQEEDMYDLIVIGGWIDKGNMNASVDAFIKRLHHKNVAFFFTLGAYPTGQHAYDCIRNIKEKLEHNNNKVITHFHCQGAIDPALIDWMKKLPKGHGHAPNQDRENRWADAANHPNEEDLRAAHNFVSTIERKLKGKENV